jgi:hypothetical protein
VLSNTKKKKLGVFCGPGRPTSCLPPSTPPEKILRGTKEIQKKTKHGTHFVLVIPMVLPSYTNPFRFEYHPIIPMITFQT